MDSQSLKRYGLVAVSALLVGVLIGSYAGCRLGATTQVVHAVNKPVDMPTISESQPAPIVSIRYIPGKPYAAIDTSRHDTVFAPVPGQFRVDTLRITEVVHDTFTRPSSVRFADVLADLKPDESSLFDLKARAEHDFAWGGYGGELRFGINLAKLHIANATIFANAGYLHNGYIGAGVEGVLWQQ